MATSDKFLALYKEYETLMRDAGKDVKTQEDSVSGVESDRLRMCRQFRNYLAHTPDPGFLEPTDKMMRFLQSQADAIKSEGDIVKKHIKKPEACILSESDKISDAYEKFSRLKCFSLLVLKKDGSYALLSVFDVIGARSTSKIGLFKMKPVKPVFVSPMQPFGSVDMDAVVLCTDTGMPDGKLLGRVWTRDGGGIC